jgi:alpha-ketoglutarate-dependent taurine dioxygenase
MGLSATQLHIIDLTPRIGSEIHTDVDTLLSGRESANIRDTLEQRGVVFFRGLDISDEQQVAIARTLGAIPENEGQSGIYKISFDKKVNERAEYLKGSMFWHFDGAVAVLRPSGDELRRDHVLAEVADEGVPDGVDTPVRTKIAIAGRHSRLCDRPASRGEPCAARATARLGHPTAVRLPP